MLTEEISGDEVRRIALSAQGLGPGHRRSANDLALVRTIAQLGLLQIDSVNVLVRAHYMPLFSRLGPYDRALLDRLMAATPKRVFEYWGHEASLLPIETQPLLRWRMERAGRGEDIWSRLMPFASERRHEAQQLLQRIDAEGPLAASDLAEAVPRKGMWQWTDAKHALEWLFWSGQVAATHRRNSFERVYDLPGRVLPSRILGLPTPPGAEARRDLMAHAARALGIATAGDLRDYFRIPAADASLAIEQLVEAGTITPVRVRGWRQQAFLHRDARVGRKNGSTTLLSPFDPLIWRRERTERVFGFRYRLEIYTPAHKREHGYYVLPFLLDGVLVARVDLKADRKTGTLAVQQVSLEPGAPPHAGDALVAELRRLADWLGLVVGAEAIVSTAALPAARRSSSGRGG